MYSFSITSILIIVTFSAHAQDPLSNAETILILNVIGIRSKGASDLF